MKGLISTILLIVCLVWFLGGLQSQRENAKNYEITSSKKEELIGKKITSLEQKGSLNNFIIIDTNEKVSYEGDLTVKEIESENLKKVISEQNTIGKKSVLIVLFVLGFGIVGGVAIFKSRY